MRKMILVATVAVLPVLMGFSACDDKKKAPEIAPTSGAVIKVEPGRSGQEIITVRWPSGDETRPRLDAGLCDVGDTYPKCAGG